FLASSMKWVPMAFPTPRDHAGTRKHSRRRSQKQPASGRHYGGHAAMMRLASRGTRGRADLTASSPLF
ncbi:hypothetical protein, partial [Stenotrophomonas sp.]|uniref:hypothetical protein n=1 Tax=Stenotrophomonas sp. TaxID=69392 RepID=UPI002FCA1BCD